MPLSETVLGLTALLALAMLASVLFRRLPVPFTVILVVIGMALAFAADTWPALAAIHHFSLTPDLVFFILLPALIFESGFNLNARQLVKDLAPVLALAIPALVISTALIGLGLWGALGLAPVIALLFGALISATDPVAVVALFRELGTPQRLTVLVEGESLLNDATAIVLFSILLGLAGAASFTWGEGVLAVLRFVEVFFGGALLGIAFGLALSRPMALLAPLGSSGVLILSLVMAYGSFVVAEHTLHVSGVMAAASAAVTLGIFGVPRLPEAVGEALRETWEFVAAICNTLLFLLVGLSVNLGNLLARLDLVALAVVLVLLARAATVYSLVPATTRLFRLPHVSAGERHIMWWGGLKGGLAIAIALSIPRDLPDRQLLLDLTLGVVVFTLLVNATTIRPLIARLGLTRLNADERSELARGLALAEHAARRILDRFRQVGLLSRAAHHRIAADSAQRLRADSPVISERQRLRRLRLDGLRAELEELDRLYKAGVVPQYTLLDLRAEIQRERERLGEDGAPAVAESQPRPNPFVRLELALIRRLREQDWAARLLARYQNLRLAQHLTRDVARALMTEAALAELEAHAGVDPAHREALGTEYRARLARLHSALDAVRRDYPEFYQGFETRLASGAALAGALHSAREQHRHGAIGAKPFAGVVRRIDAAAAQIPPVGDPVPALSPADLIRLVPLLGDLPEATVDALTGQASTVNFLAGDTIIGEGDRGDALYIVARGRAQVTQRGEAGEEALAELGEGDFFGEAALLGNQVRTATVRAAQPCTLLRLRRRDVLALADRHPEVGRRLEDANLARSGPHTS